jgi:hypothetical protein
MYYMHVVLYGLHQYLKYLKLIWRNTTITGIHSKILINWKFLLILTNQLYLF